jgi:glycosyltransferase involved in cell wall biosynthesis
MMPQRAGRGHGVKTTFEGGRDLLRPWRATRYAAGMPTLDVACPEPTLRTDGTSEAKPTCFSLGIMAWNEEDAIATALTSLLEQSVFALLAARGERAEIVVLPNGCTDRTADVARETIERLHAQHPHPDAFTARVCELEQPGRNNAWNRFVHEFSARESRAIFMMDADIVFHGADSLRNMITTLEADREAMVVTDRAHKEIEFKPVKNFRDRISLAISAMNGTNQGWFTGQLYGMRAHIARNLYLPRDFGAPDDGFFKQVICTDFLTRPQNLRRVARAPEAGHIFEAYTSVADVLKNQQRQMIGQTIVHVLLEYLKTRPHAERVNLAATLRREEARDPDWLKKLLGRHVAQARFFWQLFPGLLTFRFRRWANLGGWDRVKYLPFAVIGTAVTAISGWRAWRFLRSGNTHFWPKASRGALLQRAQA